MKLRKWVVNTLVIVEAILMMFLASDCDNLTLFFISKIIILIVMLLIARVLDKHSDLFE